MYLDTNILVYLLESHGLLSTAVAKSLEEASGKGSGLVTSTITITEFLAGTNNSNLETLRQVPRLQFMPLDESLAEQSATLQRKENLLIGGSIHLATAIHSKANLFFTNDKHLAAVARKYINIKTL